MNLIWLRNDLRINDNPALYHGSLSGEYYCVYIVTPEQWQQHNDSQAKIAFWQQRLQALATELHNNNIPLKVLNVNNYRDIPLALLDEANRTQTQAVYMNHEYPLNEQQRDAAVTELFAEHNINTHHFHGDIVMPPGSVMTQQHAIYKVFTPFCRRWHQQVTEQALELFPAPKQQTTLPFPSDDIDTLWKIGASTDFRKDLWPCDTQSIEQRANTFCIDKVTHYKEQRDIPGINGTSTLSPYLAVGAISVRQCIAKVRTYQPQWRENQWVTELIWREFYRHLLDRYPHLSRSENFISMPKSIPWENDETLFSAWCHGETGFPIVDAAMKQLRQTGWMHNRLRMISAAFLTKLCLIDWRKGERFFMEHLLDGDYASNNGGWQWAASTGADAAPYFRIFNPERQSQRFDKEGTFIKKLLPELSNLDHKSIHNPSSEQRKACAYPEPIIDYKLARSRALDSYASAMGKAK